MRKFGITMLAGICGVSLFVLAEDKPVAPDQNAMMQDMMKLMQPGEKHEVLKKLVGTWKAVINTTDMEGKPMKEEGQQICTLINDGKSVKQEFKGTMMGMPFTGTGYIGHDNATGKYQSFWIDSMSTSMTTTEGTIDPAGKVITFGGEVSCPVKKSKVPCKATLTIVSDTEHKFSMTMPDPMTGKDHTMEITYAKAQ